MSSKYTPKTKLGASATKTTTPKSFVRENSAGRFQAGATPSPAILRTKSKSTTLINASYTPSSLHRPANLTPGPLKHSMASTTPKNVVKKAKTDESLSKARLDIPNANRVRRENSKVDESPKSGNGGGRELSNLKVAVRVRPLSAKECLDSVANIVEVHNNEVIVTTGTSADNSTGVTHTFAYDNAYWSCNAEVPRYADQAEVFNGTVMPLIDKAFEGYNACLFAYGQTGSGKSYSMMGIDSDDAKIDNLNPDAGIIPRFCQELFKRINGLKGKVMAEVEISYFEIYNEKIHDLLAVSATDGIINSAINSAKKPPLKVREHPIWGPYVVDLSTHPVDSHSAIRNWLAVGNSQRATAATGMNDKSSRSHSIFSVVLNLLEIESGSLNGKDSPKIKQTKRSKISLVDLAGCERISYSGATGDRMKEGVSINKSLLTLGKVISALADPKRTHASYIPYRDSVLTWLLRVSQKKYILFFLFFSYLLN